MTGRIEGFIAAASKEGHRRRGRGAYLGLENDVNFMNLGSCRTNINVQMSPKEPCCQTYYVKTNESDGPQ